jgi:hypothetical protein
VTLLAEVSMLSSLERVIQRDPVRVFGPASVALPPPHAALEDDQGVPFFTGGLIELMLVEDMQILEDDDVVAALQVAVEVGPSEDNPEVLDLDLRHLIERVGVF